MPTNEEIKKIVDLHKSGMSQGQIAKEMSKGKSTINRVLQGLGLTNGTDTERSGTKNATDARIKYNREKRLELNDSLFGKLEEIILKSSSPRELKDLIISYGILEDKRTLLEPHISNGMEGKSAIIAFVENEKRKI